MVRGMGRETIAEFVGDEPTAAMLRGYGVDYAQGFQVGRPVPAIPTRARLVRRRELCPHRGVPAAAAEQTTGRDRQLR